MSSAEFDKDSMANLTDEERAAIEDTEFSPEEVAAMQAVIDDEPDEFPQVELSARLAEAERAAAVWRATDYEANASAYVKELQALDIWAKAQFAAIPATKRKVITSHDAFGYLAAQYQIEFLAPRGVSTDAEPSAKEVAQLIRQIQREKIKAVFVENMSNPTLVAQLARDAGVTVGATLYSDALSSADKPGATYLQMMRYNVTQLVTGMALN